MLDGLDDAVTGTSAGETKTFSTELAGGDHAGEQAEVTVTVHSVKVKELPDFDDDFAQLASEFDTIGELRADTRQRIEAMKQQQQAGQARDRAVEALLELVDVPLPDSVVADEAHRMQHQVQDQIQAAGADWDTYLQIVGKSQEEFTADLDEQARGSVKTSLVLDQLARQEDLGVDDAELSYFVTRQAEAMGVEPEVLARQLAEAGQIGAAAAEVLRGKAVARLTEQVNLKNEAGDDVSYATLIGADAEAEAEAEVIAEAEVDAAAGEEPDPVEDAEVAEDAAAIEATADDSVAADAGADDSAVAAADDSAAEKAPAKAKRASKKS
jgi:trigger factor